MSGRSRHRFDVYTDAGLPVGAQLYLLFHRVSPSQAYGVQNWLRAAGWKCEVKPNDVLSDPPLTQGRPWNV